MCAAVRREDVEAATRAAREAFREWSETPVPERVRFLFDLRSALLDSREELARGITTENGKIYADVTGEWKRRIQFRQ